MNLAKVLPMAFVMIAGPQILSAIFLATSEGWRRNSVAYITGAALSITAIVSASYFFINGISDGGSRSDTIYIVVLVLLVLAAIHTYLKRAESQPPKWMGSSKSADPEVLVQARLPAPGGFPDRHPHLGCGGSVPGEPRLAVVALRVFVGVTLFLLAIPLLACSPSANALRPRCPRPATG